MPAGQQGPVGTAGSRDRGQQGQSRQAWPVGAERACRHGRPSQVKLHAQQAHRCYWRPLSRRPPAWSPVSACM
eukprot:364861-Chlamydomonas_euryale.AAC.6